jgi:hypothetical protein
MLLSISDVQRLNYKMENKGVAIITGVCACSLGQKSKAELTSGKARL